MSENFYVEVDCQNGGKMKVYGHFAIKIIKAVESLSGVDLSKVHSKELELKVTIHNELDPDLFEKQIEEKDPGEVISNEELSGIGVEYVMASINVHVQPEEIKGWNDTGKASVLNWVANVIKWSRAELKEGEIATPCPFPPAPLAEYLSANGIEIELRDNLVLASLIEKHFDIAVPMTAMVNWNEQLYADTLNWIESVIATEDKDVDVDIPGYLLEHPKEVMMLDDGKTVNGLLEILLTSTEEKSEDSGKAEEDSE